MFSLKVRFMDYETKGIKNGTNDKRTKTQTDP